MRRFDLIRSALLLLALIAVSAGTPFAQAEPAAPATIPGGTPVSETRGKPIFNGQNLAGWNGDSAIWSVKDGVLVGSTAGKTNDAHSTTLVWRDGQLDNFRLVIEYRVLQGQLTVKTRTGPTAGDALSKSQGFSVTVPEKAASGDANEPWKVLKLIGEGSEFSSQVNTYTPITQQDKLTPAQNRQGLLELALSDSANVEIRSIRLERLPLKDVKKVVLVAGTPSHAPGEHEFNAGSTLIKKCLDESAPQVLTALYLNGWPNDPTALDNANAIVLYMDGGKKHPVLARNRLTEVDQLVKRGVGLLCLHYAVEVPAAKGGPDYLKWLGGYYEEGYSTNPHWDAKFEKIGNHPVGRGVKPFTIRDEWYFNMRFPQDETGIVRLLEATPPDGVRRTDAAKQHPGRSETVAWVYEPAVGTRGFGFTGGHFHRNWGNDEFRKLVLNAILWAARAEVPADGVVSHVSESELEKNLDPKGRKKRK